MKNLRIAIWIFLLWIIQSVFLKYIRINGIGPELLYIFALCVAMYEKKPLYYVTVGAVCGTLAELSAGRMPGFFLIFYILSVLCTIGLKEIIYRNIFAFVIPLTAILTFFENSIFFFINHNVFESFSYTEAVKTIILPVVIYNTVLAVILKPFVKKTLYKKKLRRR